MKPGPLSPIFRRLLPWAWAWACFTLLAGCGDPPAPAPGHGAAAPAFSAQTLDGARVRVPEDFRGRVVAVRFWADWCPYCRTEMADLQPVYARLAGQGLEILAVNVAQDAATARAFVQPLGIRYPVLLDPEGATARAWGVQALPITWLLDRQGVVQGKIVGEATPEVFEARVKALLDAD
jgi:cytochrome c biogenesis protein CcmG, thiol:disulfide interchange protein DsbE